MRRINKYLVLVALLIAIISGQDALFADTSTTPLPDLIVVNVTYSPASPATGQWVKAQVVIKNQGPGQAIFRVGQKVLEVRHATSGDSINATQDFIIPSGGTQSYTLTAINPYSNSAPGTYSLVYTVNPGNLPNESNTANNSATYPLTLVAGQGIALPTYDLAVESVRIDPASRGTTDTEFTFTILIKNRGNIKTQATSIGCFDKLITLDKAQGLPRYLEPGQSFEFRHKTKLPGGLQNVELSVNPSDTKGDADFSNNTRIIQVEVVDPAIGNVGGPILKLTNAYTVPAQPIQLGQEVEISGVYANCGDGDAVVPGGAIIMQVMENNRLLAVKSISPSDTIISANCMQGFVLRLPVGVLSPGLHNLLVMLDPKNVIQEKDENYHQKPLQVSVIGPDLAINAMIPPASSNPNTRSSIPIEVTIKNLGPMQAVFPAGYNLISYGAQGFTTSKMVLPGTLQLNPGQEHKAILTVPPFTPNPGNYTLMVQGDPANSMGDPNLVNNRVMLPVTLTIPSIGQSISTGTTAPGTLPKTVTPEKLPAKQIETTIPTIKTPQNPGAPR
ncbi:MAG: hypothetical protein JW927_09865 [Deltaproteobacteria bacterium]|nr:hypothetical protein [Deltaproteobacteria bacterium]